MTARDSAPSFLSVATLPRSQLLLRRLPGRLTVRHMRMIIEPDETHLARSTLRPAIQVAAKLLH